METIGNVGSDPILSAGAAIIDATPEIVVVTEVTPEVTAVVAPKVKKASKKKAKIVVVVKKKTAKTKAKKATKKAAKGKTLGRPRAYTDADLKKVGKLVAKLAKDGKGDALGRAKDILHAKSGKLAAQRVEAGFDKPLGIKYKSGRVSLISMPNIWKANSLYGAELPLGRPSKKAA